MLISNQGEVDNYIRIIKENMKRTTEQAAELLLEKKGSDALLRLKFEQIGFDPLTSESCNFIEVLNQSYSDLVIFKAVSILLKQYPSNRFIVNAGAKAGFDIESEDGVVCAECFAAVSVNSNQKLRKDIDKLMTLKDNVEKYVFFYSHRDSEDMIERKKSQYHGVNIVRIKVSDL